MLHAAIWFIISQNFLNFSSFSVHVVLPGTVDWTNFLCQSNTMQEEPLLGNNCYELCTLLHYGCPLVKVVASFCLLEMFTRLSNQRQRRHGELKCNSKYLKSVMAVLEGLLLYRDSRVTINCSLCLSMIFGWEMVKIVDGKVAEKNKWCRLIVEELAISLAVPSLVSKSCCNNQKASIYIAIALLKLEKVPGWMISVFDDTCISSMLQNLSGSSLSTELVLLFRELLNAGFLNAEHIGSVNRVFQVPFSVSPCYSGFDTNRFLYFYVAFDKSLPFASICLTRINRVFQVCFLASLCFSCFDMNRL